MNSATEVYLDNNATTQVAAECVDVIAACLRDNYGNPSSKHCHGDRAKRLVLEARAHVSALLNATPAEIVFTSGATESNHMAILGALQASPHKDQVIVSAVEHPSVLTLVQRLEAQGACVSYVPVDGEGCVDVDALAQLITPRTALVSMMWANNETGVVMPVSEAAALAHAHGALFHTDAVQAVGRIPVDVRETPVDMLSLSGHKLHGPKGIGALYVRKGVVLPPLLQGHQERGRRGGTENVPGIVGLGVACASAAESVETDSAHIAVLRDRLELDITTRIPWVRVHARGAVRLPNTSNIGFATLEAERILDRLDRAGICASPGAACTARGTEPSHVLTAMGLSREAALASIRFSLSRYTTPREVERAVDVLTDIVVGLTKAA